MNILNYSDINLKKIKIKKPTGMADKLIFNIYYLFDEDKEIDLLFRTGDMIIPYEVLYSPEKNELQFDCCNNDVLKRIESIRDYIYQKVHKAYPKLFENKNHLDKIKTKEYGKLLRLKVRNIDEIPIFDQHHKKVDYTLLKSERKIKLLLQLKWFWIWDKYYGLDYSVIQIKVYIPIQQPLFDIDDPEETKVECPNDFEKYEKMLKLKIPLEAVESKMKLDGLETKQIDIFKSKIEIQKQKSSVDTKSIIAKNDVKPENKFMGAVNFLSQITLGNFGLRKLVVNEEEEKKQKTLKKMSKYVDMSRTVPTLNDIINAKSRLRKI